jgi:hypothetical protein
MDNPNPGNGTEEAVVDPLETTPPASSAATPPQSVPPTEPPVDYEKKFADSTRENQILQSKLAEKEARERELTKEPTDSDLKAAFPHLDFDLMDPVQKESLRQGFIARRTAEQVAAERQAEKAERSFVTSVEIAIESHPDLAGREREFKAYATKYKGSDLNLVVDAFLSKKAPAAPPPAQTPRPGLETGTGGPRESEKPKSLSGDELKTLRQTDPKAYREYVMTHDIDI